MPQQKPAAVVVRMELRLNARALEHIERFFFVLFVFLALSLFLNEWGQMSDFDAADYLQVWQKVQWFRPLPGVRDLFYSFHPPLTYFLSRIPLLVFGDPVVSSQFLSLLSVISSVALLRSTLRYVGILGSVSGMCFLYITTSLPLFVFLTTAPPPDALSLFWSILILHLSVRLFWHPRYPSKREIVAPLFLSIVFAAGLLTKFTGVLNFGIPVTVIVVRRDPNQIKRSLLMAFASSLLGAVIVGPFYYTHYFLTEGVLFPNNLEWLQRDVLQVERPKRDEHPVQFIGHMLRFPREPFWGMGTPVVRDSFLHSVWFHLWKRDPLIGTQSRLGTFVSDVYMSFFFGVCLLGTMLFLLFQSRRSQPWNDLGWILIGITLTFCIALLAFGYRYPVWKWGVFKSKYIAIAFIWIPYCSALIVHHILAVRSWQGWGERIQAILLLLVLAFMCVNYLGPIY
jgi:hypothetical protein